MMSALSACATQPSTLPADSITVSGRFDLPHASDGLGAHVARVAEMHTDANLARTLGVATELLEPSLTMAFEKSLANYGYLAGNSATQTIDLRVTVRSTLTHQSEESITVQTVIEAQAPPDQPSHICFSRSGTAQFTALTPSRNRNGARTFALVAGSLLAAAAGPGGSPTVGNWMAGQLTNADRDDNALNTRRLVSEGQAVAPASGARAIRFAGINATQLAFADYIAHIADQPSCLSQPDVDGQATPTP